MGCVKRNRGETCGHFICPFADQSGYECVDMAELDGVHYCEVGEDCIKECEHSFENGTQEADSAKLAFRIAFPIGDLSLDGMSIQDAIDNDYCILVENDQEIKRLIPFLRGGNVEGWEVPIYAYAPSSVTRGRLGLGFQSEPEWLGKSLKVVELSKLM